MPVAIDSRSIIHIADIEDRFVGQKEQIVCKILFLFIEQFDASAVLSLQKGLLVAEQESNQFLCLLVTTGLCLFLSLGQSGFDRLEILDLKFRVDNLLVPDRIDISVHMDYIVVVETAKDVENSICLTDVCQKLVSKAFSFARSFHQTGDVDDVHCCRDHTLRFTHVCKHLETLVRDVCRAKIRFYRTEREIGALGFTGADAVEQSGLSDIRESYYSAF